MQVLLTVRIRFSVLYLYMNACKCMYVENVHTHVCAHVCILLIHNDVRARSCGHFKPIFTHMYVYMYIHTHAHAHIEVLFAFACILCEYVRVSLPTAIRMFAPTLIKILAPILTRMFAPTLTSILAPSIIRIFAPTYILTEAIRILAPTLDVILREGVVTTGSAAHNNSTAVLQCTYTHMHVCMYVCEFTGVCMKFIYIHTHDNSTAVLQCTRYIYIHMCVFIRVS